MPSSIINSDDGTVSGTAGLKSSAGNDGVLKIQNNGSDSVTISAGSVSVAGDLTVDGDIVGTVTNGMYTNAVQTNTANKSFQSSNAVIGSATTGLNTLEIIGTGAAAMMTFHCPGVIAGYFGLDSDNVWKVGGWSYGAASYPLMYSGSTTAPGTAPVYAARAWVNFNGTTAANPMTITGSGNVSSVTRNSTGNYTINFTTSMSDANYAVIGIVSSNTLDSVDASVLNARSSNSVSACNINTGDCNSQAFQNCPITNVAIFR